jgi:DNA invertase Pin-like site-specific DNA recombinase
MIFAEFEREMTSRRTAINAYERSKRGLANGGVAPLGYKRMKQKKGHLFIVEKEQQIVQDILLRTFGCNLYVRLPTTLKKNMT